MDLKIFAKQFSIENNLKYDETLSLIWEKCCDEIVEKKKEFTSFRKNQFDDAVISKKQFIESTIREANNTEDMVKIALFYANLSLYGDPDIIKQFKLRFGFNNFELKYFIPFDAICSELDKINESDAVRIKYNSFFKIVNSFFQLKIFDLVLHHYSQTQKLKSGNYYNSAYATLFNFNRNYLNAIRGNASNHTIKKYKMILPIENSDQYVRWINIIESIRGNSEKTDLNDIIEECVYYKCSISKLYQTIFDLLKLILPYEGLLSYDEFYQNSKQSEAYDADYKRYQYMKVKIILQNTKKIRHF